MQGDRAQKNKEHTVCFVGRANAEITGVERVESFDEQSVVLHTQYGELTLEGEGLHVGTLDMERGIVVVDGKLCGAWYREERPEKRSRFGKRS